MQGDRIKEVIVKLSDLKAKTEEGELPFPKLWNILLTALQGPKNRSSSAFTQHGN
jgi:hypothetical protein